MSADRPEDREEAYLWDRSAPEDPEVQRLERSLGSLKATAPLDVDVLPDRAGGSGKVLPLRRRVPWAVAGGFAAAAAVLVAVLSRPPPAPPIARVDEKGVTPPPGPASGTALPPKKMGACSKATEGPAFEAVVGTARCDDAEASSGRIPPGVWLETPATSRVRIDFGEIGKLDVSPGTKLRLVRSTPQEQRLELARGKIHAKIDAPPRLFVIQTRAAVAVDLGCEYELEVDDAGAGKLVVKNGFVALETPPKEVWGPGPTRSTLVPRNAEAAIHSDTGPGLPIWSREPESIKAAARRFDVHPETPEVFETIFAGLGDRDTLTLVHLLDRVDGERRTRVLAKLEVIAPPKPGVRDRLLAGDADAIAGYRDALVPRWFPKQP